MSDIAFSSHVSDMLPERNLLCYEMKWLTQATPEQQQDFEIESDGYGVWWNKLDDGIALHHILSPATVPGLAAVA
ncbi:MAG: hypothetical protein Fur0022_24540 [Anaerolineales bacterium]